MISRKDWERTYRHLLAEGRNRTGPPPTFEEVDALSRGQLPEPEAERVRERLAYYPDLLRVMTEPMPASAGDVLTSEELAADLAKIRERTTASPDPKPPLEFPRRGGPARIVAIAAGVVIALALGSLALRRLTSEPRPLTTRILYADGERGGTRGGPAQAPVRLSADTDYTLEPVFSSRRHYADYRVELLDLGTTPPRRIWTREHVVQKSDGTYPVPMSTENLEPGLYRLVLYGIDGNVDRLAEYTLRLAAP